MWTCTQCREQNSAGATFCDVCSAPHPAATRAPGGPEVVRDTVPVPARYPEPAEYAEESGHAWTAGHTDYVEASGQSGIAGSAEPSLPPPIPQPRRRRLRPALFAVLLIAGMVIGSVLTFPRLFGSDDRDTGTATPFVEATPAGSADVAEPVDEPTWEPDPADEPVSEPEPAVLGIVTIDPGITDSRAGGVAAMFDAYFSGINDKDYDRVADVLDPSGSVDPTSADEMAGLEAGTRSTQDSEISLRSLSDLDDGQLLAGVAFRSQQEPGAGPKGRTYETCTQWQVAYTVSTSTGAYRLVKGAASAEPC